MDDSRKTSADSGSHASDIVRTLEEDLLGGRLQPGDRLDERKLAARFGVSRTPIREALQRLAANGIVVLPARQAASVARLDIPDLLDSFIVIAELEAVAAGLAARRIQQHERTRLRDVNEACAEAARLADEEAFNAANDLFHDAIIQASHNRILIAQIRTAQLLTTPYRRQITFQPGRMRASIEEHQGIVDAILRSDAADASERMRAHVNQLAQSAADFLHHLRLSFPAA